jgi:hypothetical protein
MREDDREEPEEREEKRYYLDEIEISSDTYYLKLEFAAIMQATRITRIHDLQTGGSFPPRLPITIPSSSCYMSPSTSIPKR